MNVRVVGLHGDLVLCGIANWTFIVSALYDGKPGIRGDGEGRGE